MFIGISYSKCFWSFSFVISINEIASVDSFSLHKLCIKGIYSIKSNNVTSLTNKRIIGINWPRLRVAPNFSSGIVEQAKRQREWKSPHARKCETRRGERKMLGQTSNLGRVRSIIWIRSKNDLSSERAKYLIFLSPRRVSPFLAWGDFYARSRFARSTIPEEKWGTARSL